MSLSVNQPTLTGTGGKSPNDSFMFDRVFDEFSTQEDVFKESVKELVQSSLDGYRVCVLSYGQSGSGKVFISTSPLSTPKELALNFINIRHEFY
jgi:kinesin family protein C1